MTLAAFCAVALLAASILWAYHDRSWWGPDDGAYAHVAERLLEGQVLNRDVHDIHGGAVHFVNAAALRLFGLRLVSMRYPLAALTLLQTGLIFLLLLPRGRAVAAAGGLGMAALSFVQFPNPTANWYALFLTTVIVGVLAWMPRGHGARWPILGFLLMTLFLFRQLSGVLVGVGLLAYLLAEEPRMRSGPRDRMLARGLLALMGAGLAAYLAAVADPFATLVFGAAPLGLLFWAAFRTTVSSRESLRMVAHLAAGGALALAPLVAYHAVHGSLGNWVDDAIFSALRLPALDFFDRARYSHLLAGAAGEIPTANAVVAVNGLFWMAVLALAPALGILTLGALPTSHREQREAVHPLPFLAVFHALLALHYQIPIYLMYTAALSLAGLLWLAAQTPGRGRAGAALALALAAVGLVFHAGQPLTRGLAGILAGQRTPVVAAPGLERAGLRLAAGQVALYEDLLAVIEREVPPGGAILALPAEPELYFLSRRSNPTPFVNAALGIASERDLETVLAALRRTPPVLVIHRPRDKYNTALVGRLLAALAPRYHRLDAVGPFDIYRLRAAARPAPETEEGEPHDR